MIKIRFEFRCLMLLAMMFLFAPSIRARDDIAPHLLIHYQTWSDKLAVTDRIASVRIYADGRVDIYRPFWWSQPGRFVTKLSPTELAEILVSLHSADSTMQSGAALAAQVTDSDQRQARTRRQIVEASEHVATVIDYRLTVAGEIRGFSYENLQFDAERKPELAGLQQVHRLNLRLHGLLADQLAKPVSSGAQP